MDIAWPQKGDHLFKPGGHRKLAIPKLNKTLSYMALGYRLAGDLLVQRLEQNYTGEPLVFPIIFCYRQYVELTLKEIIQYVHDYEGTGEDYKKIHNLKDLWDTLMTRIVEEVEDEERESFEVVEDIIVELNDVDPQAITFRYPEPALLPDIDLGNLRDTMERLSMFLDSLRDQQETALYNSS